MGISGLIPFLDKASSKINVKDIKGSTVAIDTYCWLHKGAYGCAEKLSRGESTNVHILYCLKFINMLLSYNIKPIMVFDGRHLPAKAMTEKKRRESRKQAKKRAVELLRLGQIDEARVQLRRCIDITHEMVLDLIHECRKRNVDCIVAPYEADAQLAYLNKKNIAQYVITEDSDLTLFGTSKVIFKLDLTGNGLLVEAEKFSLAMGCKPEKYTFDKFRNMCILSGCDYLDSLPGIGLAKACKFFLKNEDNDMRRALKKIPQYLNMKNLVVHEEYIEEFLQAEATFKFMYVYDPFYRKMVRLNDLPENLNEYEYLCSNAGSLLDNEIAFKLALGNLDPFTLKELDNWHPDHNENSKTRNGNKKPKHSSIWESNYKPHINKKQMFMNAFTFKKIIYPSFDNAQSLENQVKDESSVVCLYSKSEPPLKKKRNLEYPITCDNEENLNITISENENRHNPFAKCVLENSNKINNSIIECDSNESIEFKKLEQLSKFERTVIDKSKEIKSRFFESNKIIVQEIKEIEKFDESEFDNKNNMNNLNDVLSSISTNNNNENVELQNLYSPVKISTISDYTYISDSEDESTLSENIKTHAIKETADIKFNIFELNNKQKITTQNEISDSMDISNFKVTLNSEKNMVPRIGLSRKKSRKQIGNDINLNSQQTRLSMFGFKKKSGIQK